MAFTTIPSALINVGKAIKKEIFTYVKDNFDDHESRLNTIEAGGSTSIEIFNDLVSVASTDTYTGIDYFVCYAPTTLDTVEIRIFAKGGITSGILEIDILKSTSDLDDSNFSSILTTKASIDFSTASDYDVSVNAVIDGDTSALTQGDILRLDITSIPAGLESFVVNVSGA